MSRASRIRLPPPTAFTVGAGFLRRRARRPSPARASNACRRASSKSASRRRKSAGSCRAARGPIAARGSLRIDAAIDGRGRTREHALTDAPLDLLRQFLRRHREHQHRRRPADHPACRPPASSRSMPASQPQSITEVAKPVSELRCVHRPRRRMRGDDEPRRLHRERFREGDASIDGCR